MKKLVASNPACKLAVRGETVRVLRQLTLRELRDRRFAGGSNPICDGSTNPPWSEMCD